jgi:hypothetical protein
MKIAVGHPGKIGDALYTLPTIRHISKLYDCKIDFYTSEHCHPILEFMEQQDCINKAYISSQYKIERYDMGVQPWYVPVDDDYDKVYQLGFQSVPDKPLPEFIAESVGFDKHIGRNIYYDVVPSLVFFNKYYIIAPRGNTSFTPMFENFIDRCGTDVVIVGSKGDNCFKQKENILDYTGGTFTEMASLIKHSSGYLGIMSGPLVIANGFDVKKYIPYTDAWDMRHIVRKPESLYSKTVSVEECLQWFGVI